MSTSNYSLFSWLLSLVNPPPRDSMTTLQKVARVFFFTTSLIVICILLSMMAAVGIYTIQHIYHWGRGIPGLMADLGIIFVSMLVNTFCVVVLLKVKNADLLLMNSPGRTEQEKSPDKEKPGDA